MNTILEAKETKSTKPTRTTVCLASCRKLFAQIEHAKGTILADFREALKEQEHLLHLTLNEAEALAWQTGFPELVFPTLAMEKVQSVAAWHERQQSLWRTNSTLASAA